MLIDGHNIQNIGLHTLRNGISIIPQIPFIFSGTIRSNFDPLNKYKDQQIEDVLKEIGLDQQIYNLPSKFMIDLTHNQQIFSICEKQLICLGRVILRQSKIIILDEATANYDMNTDELIQKLIREKFQNSTVLTIAHHVNTIADYDKIIVMGSGQIIEQGCPYELLKDKNRKFYQMVENTGLQNKKIILQLSIRQFTINQNIQIPQISISNEQQSQHIQIYILCIAQFSNNEQDLKINLHTIEDFSFLSFLTTLIIKVDKIKLDSRNQ